MLAPPMNTPAPMYTPYRTEPSELDSPGDPSLLLSAPQELPSPPLQSSGAGSVTPFAPSLIYPSLGTYSVGLGVSDSSGVAHRDDRSGLEKDALLCKAKSTFAKRKLHFPKVQLSRLTIGFGRRSLGGIHMPLRNLRRLN